MGREELARLTDEFLKRGGKIQKIPEGQSALSHQEQGWLTRHKVIDGGYLFGSQLDLGEPVQVNAWDGRGRVEIVNSDGHRAEGCYRYLPQGLPWESEE